VEDDQPQKKYEMSFERGLEKMHLENKYIVVYVEITRLIVATRLFTLFGRLLVE